MINFTELKQTFVAWSNANAGTTVTTIMAELYTPKPAKPYVTLKFLSNNELGFGEEVLTNTPGIIDVKGIRDITLSINVYGGDAQTIAENLRTSLRKPTVYEVFRNIGVSLVELGNIISLTTLLETKFEDRTQFDIRFYVASNVTDDVNWIQNVEKPQGIF